MADFIARIGRVLDSESEAEVLAAFDRLETPEELHLVADNWNWDDGATPSLMRRIVESPFCDRGTASLVYWRTDGVFATYASAQEAEGWERDFFQMCLRVEEKVNGGQFESSIIRFDPMEDFDPVGLQRLLTSSPRVVPSFMLDATPGTKLPKIDF